MLRRILLMAEEAISETSDVEARTALISAALISLAIYISSFHPIISAIAIFTAILSCQNPMKVVKGITASLPFLLFFAASSYFLGGDAVYTARVTFGLAALIAIGSGILYGMLPEDLTYALMYFRIPYRYASLISLAFRMFQVFIRDVAHAIEALKLSGERGFSYYRKLIKTIASIAVLRSIGISETLYSRGFNLSGRVQPRVKKLGSFDYLLLLISALILVIAIFLIIAV